MTMANNWDAVIKQLYPADDNTTFTADTVKLDAAFDVIANVEVGRNLMQFADSDELCVAVRNLTQSTTVTQVNAGRPLKAVDSPLNEDIKVDIPTGWKTKAKPGDLLEVVATYRMDAGIHTDYSSAISQTFIVTA
jgi:hypothetical protein